MSAGLSSTKMRAMSMPPSNPQTHLTDALFMSATSSLESYMLFPTYARKINSNSKSSSEASWAIRVRGWTYSQKTNRTNKLVLKAVRRWAGVTKHSEMDEMLKSCFSMFMVKSLRKRQLIVGVTGLSEADHLELDGDPEESGHSSATLFDSEEVKHFSTCENFTEDSKLKDAFIMQSQPLGDAPDENDIGSDLTALFKEELEHLSETDSTDEGSGESDTSLSSASFTSGESTLSLACQSEETGHFQAELQVSPKLVEEWAKMEGLASARDARLIKLQAHHPGELGSENPVWGVVNLIEPEGISVISDIDDTIKDTQILAGARVAFNNTFLEPPKEVPGMADIYRRWYDKGVAFHYVSNSPWQLFPMLRRFFQTYRFPPGSAHLRFINDVVNSMWKGRGDAKLQLISKIMSDFPGRKFILIGDSGEVDLEIYTRIAKKYPNQVLKIFIRDVTTPHTKNTIAARPTFSGRALSLPFFNSKSSEADPVFSEKEISEEPHAEDNQRPVTTSSLSQKSLRKTGSMPSPSPPAACVPTFLEERVRKASQGLPSDLVVLYRDAKELEKKVTDVETIIANTNK
ncbi:uncharacterized protein VTP21DRAFT_7163 [Calcarisporiella thermophila]|uniref:uncharacterized protein n=1 Tax=Calcarisporiella thermophila TaxID=911321 RepID=UPI00374320DA